MTIDNARSAVENAYQSIDFTQQYKALSVKYDFDLDTIVSRMNKTENLKVLNSFDYTFKVSSPGQYYLFVEHFGQLELRFMLQISKGMITDYFRVFYEGEKVRFPDNLAFVYRKLLDDPSAEIKAMKFMNYDDLRNIVSDLLKLYEGFKDELLKNAKTADLI